MTYQSKLHNLVFTWSSYLERTNFYQYFEILPWMATYRSISRVNMKTIQTVNAGKRWLSNFWWKSNLAHLSVMRVWRELRGVTPSVYPLRKVTHPFFIAPYTEYPLLIGIGLFGILTATVNYLHEGQFSKIGEPGFLLFVGGVICWLYDLNYLSQQSALYTTTVRHNLISGVILFIISEVMIFFGLFWAYFHSSLNPAVELGATWPPQGIKILVWYQWPTMSTLLLIFSGFSANVAYYAMVALNDRNTVAYLSTVFKAKLDIRKPFLKLINFIYPNTNFYSDISNEVAELYFETIRSIPFSSVKSLLFQRRKDLLSILYNAFQITIFAGFCFMLCQYHEYNHAAYNMSDGIYASVFYGLTGLHGLHVFAGLLLLVTVFLRFIFGQYLSSNSPHLMVTTTVWYWHFVDIVWIFLFGVVYIWGNASTETAISVDAMEYFWIENSKKDYFSQHSSVNYEKYPFIKKNYNHDVLTNPAEPRI